MAPVGPQFTDVRSTPPSAPALDSITVTKVGVIGTYPTFSTRAAPLAESPNARKGAVFCRDCASLCRFM